MGTGRSQAGHKNSKRLEEYAVIWKRDLGFVDITGRGAQPKESSHIGPGFERCLLYLGVILPVLALLFENEFHLCARSFFDPFPSNSHAMLFAMIPAANLLAWLSLSRNLHSQLGLALFANGMAVGVAILYTLMFFPVLPSSAMAILIFGIGLLAFAPLFGLGVLCFAGSKVCKVAEAARTYFNPHQVNHAGHLVILAMVLAVELPSTLTRVALGMANNPETAQKGIGMLRAFGNHEVMLRACYERSGRATDILGSLYESSHPVNVEDMRRIFYKVTGRTYNSFPIPEAARATMNHMGTLGYDGIDNGADDEFDADPDIAGEMVAGVSRGLSVSRSRLDGKFDADAAVGQIDWFLDFKNVSKFDREVRTRIQMPQGAAINRASLIVNGKEYECRISLKEEARAIYRAAVESHRNPLLVSVSGKDSVLVQCYPVPPGEKLQLHIGMVTPLSLDKNKEAVLSLPQFEERNFQINVPHALTLSSNHELKAPWAELKFEHPDAKTFVLQGPIEASRIATGGGIIHLKRSNIESFICKDKFSAEHYSCGNHLKPVETSEFLRDLNLNCPSSLHIVIDCSENMKEHFAKIIALLSELPAGIKSVTLTCVTDSGNVSFAWSGKIDNAKLEKLRSIYCTGGQSDGAALLEEVTRNIVAPNSALLWIHGPQPIAQDRSDDLMRRLEHCPNFIYDMQIASGPNTYLDGTNPQFLHKIARFGTVEEDLRLLFTSWTQPGVLKKFELTSTLDRDYYLPELTSSQASGAECSTPATLLYQGACAAAGVSCNETEPQPETAPEEAETGSPKPSTAAKPVETMDCLSQLWAKERIDQLLSHGYEPQALALAARYHLVTPVSSAILADTVPELERMSCPQSSLESQSYKNRLGHFLGILHAPQELLSDGTGSVLQQLNRLNAIDNVEESRIASETPEPPCYKTARPEQRMKSDASMAYIDTVKDVEARDGDGFGMEGAAAGGGGMPCEVQTGKAADKIAYNMRGSSHIARHTAARRLSAGAGSLAPSTIDRRTGGDAFDTGVVTGGQIMEFKKEAPSLAGSTNGSISPVTGSTMQKMQAIPSKQKPALSPQPYSSSHTSQVQNYPGSGFDAAPAPVRSLNSLEASNESNYIAEQDQAAYQADSKAAASAGCAPACPPQLKTPPQANGFLIPRNNDGPGCIAADCYPASSLRVNNLELPLNQYGEPDFLAFATKYWFAVLGLFFLTYSIVQMSLRRLGLLKAD